MNFKNQLWTDGPMKKILKVLINLKHYCYNEVVNLTIFSIYLK